MKKQKKTRVFRYISLISCLMLCLWNIPEAISQEETALAPAAQQPRGTVVDKIIAKVDNYIILKSELERQYLDVLSRGEYLGPNGRCTILESIVVSKLMAAKAEIDSVVVEEEMVQRDLSMRMNMMIQRFGSEEMIEEYYKKSIAEFKDELYDQVKEQMVVQTMQQTIVEGIKVTPSEVKRFFKSIPKDSLPYFSTEVTLGQIVKKPGVSEEEKESIRNTLLKVRTQILNGETSFEEMARQYSEDPSGPRGGFLGWSKRGDMVSEFEAAAMRMKEGDISMPVETEFGYHLVQLLERRGNEYNSRHILIRPKHTQKDFDQAYAFLDSIRSRILSDSITFQSAAKRHSDDKETAGSGGFILGETGAPRIATSDLDANLFFTIDTLKVGDITKPIRFTMPDGKDALRILYYRDRIRPHQANLQDDYQKIQMAAMQAKRSKVLDDWFNEARLEVFIDIDPEYNHCKILDD